MTRWTWAREVEALRNIESRDAWMAASVFRQMLSDAYERLRVALDDGGDPSVTWDEPFITIPFDFPVDMASTDPLPPDLSPEDLQDRKLLLMLEIFTAGAGIEFTSDEAEELLPRLPDPVSSCLSGIPERNLNRLWQKWFKGPEWASPTYYGIAHLENSELRDIWGFGAESRFGAALSCEISPRIYFADAPRSAFLVTVGLPYVLSEEANYPQEWTEAERTALWATVTGFFATALNCEAVDDLPLPVTTEVCANGSGSAQFTRFEAAFLNAEGLSFLERTLPRQLEETYLACLPRYALGSRGPELPMSDGEGGLKVLAPVHLQSVMAYPGDEVARQQLIVTSKLYVMSECREVEADDSSSSQDCGEHPANPGVEGFDSSGQDRDLLTSQDLAFLREAPSEKEVISRTRAKLFGGGTAGHMLLHMVRCAEHHPEHVSVKKACYLSSQLVGNTPGWDGRPQSSGQSTYRAFWSEFRSVAHLWAALMIFKGEDEQPTEGIFTGASGEIQRFLKVAEQLRLRGERTFARGQWTNHGPVLDPAKTWRAPADLILPEFPLTFEPFPPATLQILANYKPPKLH